MACFENCYGNGICKDAKCQCFDGYFGPACLPRRVKRCPADCSGHGECVDGICNCFQGWHEVDCSMEGSSNLENTSINNMLQFLLLQQMNYLTETSTSALEVEVSILI